VFRVPWPVATLIAALVIAHIARVVAGVDADQFALTGVDMAAGRLTGLITYQFVHMGWTHLGMNALFILAFGPPVARFLGPRARGVIAFVAFFLTCGVFAGAYGLFIEALALARHAPSAWALVGASGAASGLMGASARLIEGRGRLGPVFGPKAVAMAVSWIAINVVLGLTGLTPGAAGAPVAWEAHIFGFIAGLLFIGPFGRIAGIDHDHEIAL
jgi:membrane associated rhomboid family serine protease